MPRQTLERLGAIVREKRGPSKLRETARAIGIGPATLMRVEAGRIPDVETFGKLCKWLGTDPGTLLGFQQTKSARTETENRSLALISAHARADQVGNAATVQALAQMVLLALKMQAQRSESDL